jgi:CBS domain-containing protein
MSSVGEGSAAAARHRLRRQGCRRNLGRTGTPARIRRDQGPATEEGEMATARDIMTGGAECVGENETLVEAARKMRDLDVGSLPICGEDDRLKGMVTDRDIVVRCIADGGDPSSTKAGDLAQGKPITVGADDSVEEILRTMTQYKVRRLPVIDGHQLVGMVSQGDVARNVPEEKVGDLVEAISS